MKYRKKPIVIEAIQYLNNPIECINFTERKAFRIVECLVIPTLEGEFEVRKNDWIIKGIRNEFYPCKPDIFEETYEEVEE